MGILGNLWVRLGLKMTEFISGMDSAKSKTEEFGGAVKGMKNIAQSVWAAIGKEIKKAAKDFLTHSQLIGDAWNNLMAGMKAAWSNFLTTLTNWDWSGFKDKINGAFDAAKASSAAHDAEFEVKNSIAIRKSQMQEELAQLQIIARDTRKSYQERADAANKYLDMVRPLYEDEIMLRERLKKVDLDEYLTNAGASVNEWNRQALQKFLTDVTTNEELLNALREYDRKNNNKNYKKFDQKLVDAFLKDKPYSDAGTYARLASYYIGSGDKEAKKVVDAIVNLGAAKAAFDEETRRLQTLANTADARSAEGTKAASNTAELDALKKQAENILKAAEESQMTERELLKKHLDEKLALLEQFGMNTTPVILQYLEEDADLLKEEYDAITAETEAFINSMDDVLSADLEFELPDIVKDMMDRMEEQVRRGEELAEDFNRAVAEGFSNGCREMSDQLFGLKEVNGGAILEALLTPFAELAIKEGELLIANGVGVEALKTALSTLNGAAAIAAGAALVAIGTAAKSGLAALASKGSAAGVSTTASSAVNSSSPSSTGVQSMELNIKLEGRLSGSDIVLAAERTQKAWAR